MLRAIWLSRLDWQQSPGRDDRISLLGLADDVRVELEPLAEERHIRVRVEGDRAVAITGDRTLVAVLIRNLMDNAIRYGGSVAEVSVSVSQKTGDAMLSITDGGPGIPAGEIDNIFRRFHRLPGSGSPGAGLGLSIVKKICRIHGAKLDVGQSPGGGLKVEVGFPGGG